MNILLIDDHETLVDGIRNWVAKIQPEANFYYAQTAKAVHALVYQKEINVVICDLELNQDPEIDGFNLIEKLLEFEPRIKVIAYTGFNS